MLQNNTMILARKCHTVCYQHLNHKVFLGSTKTVCGPTNKDRNIQIHLSYPDIIVETGTGAQAHSSPTTIHQNKKKWINFKYLFVHIVVPAPPLITPVTCHLNSISEGVLLKKKKPCFIIAVLQQQWTAFSVSDASCSFGYLYSVRLHAQLGRITAIVRQWHSIRQLQLSKYTCRWENRIIGPSMSYPGTLGGAVSISTSGNRNTSGWPLYVTSCLSFRERWRTKSKEKLHICTFRIWCTW